MLVKELKNILDTYNDEMEIIVLDEEKNCYEFNGVTLDYRDTEPTLALEYR